MDHDSGIDPITELDHHSQVFVLSTPSITANLVALYSLLYSKNHTAEDNTPGTTLRTTNTYKELHGRVTGNNSFVRSMLEVQRAMASHKEGLLPDSPPLSLARVQKRRTRSSFSWNSQDHHSQCHQATRLQRRQLFLVLAQLQRLSKDEEERKKQAQDSLTTVPTLSSTLVELFSTSSQK